MEKDTLPDEIKDFRAAQPQKMPSMTANEWHTTLRGELRELERRFKEYDQRIRLRLWVAISIITYYFSKTLRCSEWCQLKSCCWLFSGCKKA